MRTKALLALTTSVTLAMVACTHEEPTQPAAASASTSTVRAVRGGPGSGKGGGAYDLVRLAGDGSDAAGLNDQGTVVGHVSIGGVDHPAYWVVDGDGSVNGPLEIDVSGPASARRVNAAGQVVVRTRNPNSATGFVYDIATDELVELSGVPGAVRTDPWAINDLGYVAGTAYYDETSGAGDRPVIWSRPFDPATAPSVLPLPAGYDDVCARTHINESEIVAFALPADGANPGDCRAVRWTIESDGSVADPELVGVTTGFEGFELNDVGQVAGNLAGRGAAVLGPDGVVVELAPLDGHEVAMAFGLSDSPGGEPARVVGTSDYGPVSSGDTTAVVWSVDLAGNVTGPTAMPTGRHETSVGRTANESGWVIGRVVDTRKHTSTAAVWLPVRDGGSGDGGGGPCTPKGPHGNNCK